MCSKYKQILRAGVYKLLCFLLAAGIVDTPCNITNSSAEKSLQSLAPFFVLPRVRHNETAVRQASQFQYSQDAQQSVRSRYCEAGPLTGLKNTSASTVHKDAAVSMGYILRELSEGRVTGKYPPQLQIDPTLNCAFKLLNPEMAGNCEGCPFSDIKGAVIPWERLKSVLDIFVDGGGQSIFLTGGGEPGEYPGLEKLLEYLAFDEKGRRLELTFNTNGAMAARLWQLASTKDDRQREKWHAILKAVFNKTRNGRSVANMISVSWHNDTVSPRAIEQLHALREYLNLHFVIRTSLVVFDSPRESARRTFREINAREGLLYAVRWRKAHTAENLAAFLDKSRLAVTALKYLNASVHSKTQRKKSLRDVLSNIISELRTDMKREGLISYIPVFDDDIERHIGNFSPNIQEKIREIVESHTMKKAGAIWYIQDLEGCMSALKKLQDGYKEIQKLGAALEMIRVALSAEPEEIVYSRFYRDVTVKLQHLFFEAGIEISGSDIHKILKENGYYQHAPQADVCAASANGLKRHFGENTGIDYRRVLIILTKCREPQTLDQAVDTIFSQVRPLRVRKSLMADLISAASIEFKQQLMDQILEALEKAAGAENAGEDAIKVIYENVRGRYDPWVLNSDEARIWTFERELLAHTDNIAISWSEFSGAFETETKALEVVERLEAIDMAARSGDGTVVLRTGHIVGSGVLLDLEWAQEPLMKLVSAPRAMDITKARNLIAIYGFWRFVSDVFEALDIRSSGRDALLLKPWYDRFTKMEEEPAQEIALRAAQRWLGIQDPYGFAVLETARAMASKLALAEGSHKGAAVMWTPRYLLFWTLPLLFKMYEPEYGRRSSHYVGGFIFGRHTEPEAVLYTVFLAERAGADIFDIKPGHLPAKGLSREFCVNDECYNIGVKLARRSRDAGNRRDTQGNIRMLVTASGRLDRLTSAWHRKKEAYPWMAKLCTAAMTELFFAPMGPVGRAAYAACCDTKGPTFGLPEYPITGEMQEVRLNTLYNFYWSATTFHNYRKHCLAGCGWEEMNHSFIEHTYENPRRFATLMRTLEAYQGRNTFPLEKCIFWAALIIKTHVTELLSSVLTIFKDAAGIIEVYQVGSYIKDLGSKKLTRMDIFFGYLRGLSDIWPRKKLADALRNIMAYADERTIKALVDWADDAEFFERPFKTEEIEALEGQYRGSVTAGMLPWEQMRFILMRFRGFASRKPHDLRYGKLTAAEFVQLVKDEVLFWRRVQSGNGVTREQLWASIVAAFEKSLLEHGFSEEDIVELASHPPQPALYEQPDSISLSA